MLVVGGAALVVLWGALTVATWQLAQSKFDGSLEGDPLGTLTIADPDLALTFARIDSAAGPRVVLVTGAGPDGLMGVDLEAASGRSFRDGAEAFVELGFDALANLSRDTEPVPVSMDALTLPLDLAYPHIAAGTNFSAHAEEVGQEGGPFLFPKLSHATPWNADVPHRGRLDHEVELCAVTLSTHSKQQPAALGFLLCNDFTDRWTLLRDIDLGAPMGPTGFPDAKGGEGMLPVGALLVIPRAADAFYRGLTLELYVNGRLRQHASGGQMIWSPDEILTRAMQDCDVTYYRQAGTIGLTDCSGIPARTLILTGTPEGVMFHPLTIWSASAYLEPGDEVIARASHLGVLRNRVR